jgi:hypothetical protein
LEFVCESLAAGSAGLMAEFVPGRNALKFSSSGLGRVDDLKSGIAKMAVEGKRDANSRPAHYGKGNTIVKLISLSAYFLIQRTASTSSARVEGNTSILSDA